MERIVPLSTGLGEVMAPQTLVAALILTPDGKISVEPGALHGRSAIESSLRFVSRREEVSDAQVYWFVWVAVELDASDAPVRYRGVAVSELWVDPVNKVGYKVLVEHVNRMSEAMRGGVNLKALNATEKSRVAQQLIALGTELWEQSSPSLKAALAS